MSFWDRLKSNLVIVGAMGAVCAVVGGIAYLWMSLLMPIVGGGAALAVLVVTYLVLAALFGAWMDTRR